MAAAAPAARRMLAASLRSGSSTDSAGWERVARGLRAASCCRALSAWSGQTSHAFPVPVGSSVAIKLDRDGLRADVNVRVNDSLETIRAELQWESGADQEKCESSVVATQDASSVTIGVHGAPEESILEKLKRVNVWIPERWASVQACSRGNVAIENVVKFEGSMSVQAQLDACTQGGSMGLGRILGNKVTLASGGGHIDIGSVYAQRLNIETQGGDISIETFRADQSAVQSNGGAIKVEGLDGCAFRPAQLKVIVSSGGGNIKVYVPATLEAVVIKDILHGPQQDCLNVHPKISEPRSCNWTSSSQEGRLAQGNKDWQGHLLALRTLTTLSGKCTLKLSAGEGTIEVKRRGWMDALVERLAQPLTSPASSAD
eukprot:SM000093S24407  [mRNA]  locus=s93:96056:99415:+ [translate_table: standard]